MTYDRLYSTLAPQVRPCPRRILPFVRSPPVRCCVRKLVGAAHTVAPRVVNGDKNHAYPPAFKLRQQEGELAPECELRPVKYLNNLIEQDHRFIKRRVKPGLGFSWYRTAWATLRGYEAMNQLRKGQVQGTNKGDSSSQHRFIARSFGVAACALL
jgi:transposase-like protein